MKRKSIFSFALILTLVLSIISGCSSNNNNASSDDGNNGNANAKNDDSATPKKKVEISFWYGWGGPEGEKLEKLIQKFNDSQDRIVVKGTLEADYSKQMTAITAGSPPDVASQFGFSSVPWGIQGAMTPLDSYMEKSGVTASDFVPGAIQQSQYDGKTYALPVAMHISMMFYNKDLLAQAGYDKAPETLTELYQFYDKLNQIESNGEIKRLAFNPNLDIYTFAYIFGGGFYDYDKKEITPQDPGFIQAMKQGAMLWKKGGGSEKLNPFFEKLGAAGTAEDPFFQGKYAAVSNGEWYGTQIKQFAPANFNYLIAPYPYDDKHPDSNGANVANTSTFYIPKGAKHPDEAWEFIRWFMQPENIAEFDSGIGNLPPVIAALDSPLFNDVPGFKEFLEASKSPNIVSFPATPYMGEYQNEIGVAYNDVLLGTISAEQGAKQIADKMKPILEKYKQ